MAEAQQHLIIGLGGTGANVRDRIQKAVAERLKSQEDAKSVCIVIDDPDTENPEAHNETEEGNPDNP